MTELTLSEKLDGEFWDALEKRENYGNLRGLQATADDVLKTEDAFIRDDAPNGTVAEVDAWVRTHPRHGEAVKEKKNKYAEWAAAELKMKILFALKDKYQTDSKLARDMDQAHR